MEYSDEELEVGEAMYYVQRMYERITKRKPLLEYCFKENEVLYVDLNKWCYTDNTFDFKRITTLCRIVHRACSKFEDVQYPLVANLIHKIPLDTGELCWMSGYFMSIFDSYNREIIIEFKSGEGDSNEKD